MQPTDVDIYVLIIVLMILIVLALAIWLARHRNDYLAWLRLRAVARVMPCAPTKPAFPFPSECLGQCLDGGECRTTETRPWLIFWRQAAKCACVHPAEGQQGGDDDGGLPPSPRPPDGGGEPPKPAPGPGT